MAKHDPAFEPSFDLCAGIPTPEPFDFDEGEEVFPFALEERRARDPRELADVVHRERTTLESQVALVAGLIVTLRRLRRSSEHPPLLAQELGACLDRERRVLSRMLRALSE